MARFSTLLIGVLALGCTAETTDPVAAGRSSGSATGGGGAGSGADAAASTDFDIKGSGTSGGSGDTSCNGLLVAYIRDFHESHPDMEKLGKDNHGAYTWDLDIVTDMLGDDQKPVFKMATNTTTDASNFWQWYNDVEGVNQGFEYELQFTELSEKKGTWKYSSGAFFPADGKGFKELSGTDDQGVQHNFHFTLELHARFKFHQGQEFYFTGDDDVFAYIDGHRVVDLGGVHETLAACVTPGGVPSANHDCQQTYDLNQLELVDGEIYPLDFFFAERHVTQSNFTIETSLAFTKCDIIIK